MQNYILDKYTFYKVAVKLNVTRIKDLLNTLPI